MSQNSSSTRTKVVIGIVGVVIAALVVALFSGSGDDSSSSSSPSSVVSAGENRPVVVTGDVLPPAMNENDDPAVGTRAPAIDGQSFDGSAVTITPGDGRAHMIVFLAHWCPHCNAEVPRLISWYESGGVPDGLDVVGVSTAVASDRPNYPPSQWTLATGWPWPIIADSETMDAASAYGVTAFPFFVVVGADGTVKVRVSGEVEIDTLEQILADALAS